MIQKRKYFFKNISQNKEKKPLLLENNIVAKKTTELVLLFHKETTKLVFLWPNMSQKSTKVLKATLYILYI